MTEEKKEAIEKEIEKKEKTKHSERKKDDKVVLSKDEIIAMNKKIAESEERALRSNAELVNYRKRKDEEVQRLLKYSNENLILDILPILDNFERALKMEEENKDENVTKFINGMKMVYESLKNTLIKYEVTEIEALGKTFDPKFHSAVMTETDDNKEKEIILEVYQKGYIFKDKVIRPAMVKVNK